MAGFVKRIVYWLMVFGVSLLMVVILKLVTLAIIHGMH